MEKKTLEELTLDELGQLFPIIIQDYSDKWNEFYKAEQELISGKFSPSEIVRIDHIGSTAIPCIKAKPTIDILVQVCDHINIQKIKEVFKSLNYQINEHPDNPPPHLTFVKGYTAQGVKEQTYHVHIRYEGDWDEIRFRNYLLNNKEVAREYERLKQILAHKYRNDREAYTNSKSEFIEKINKLAKSKTQPYNL